MCMKTTEFDYYLPEQLIAQTPIEPRDSSRMLVLHRRSKQIEHRTAQEIVHYLQHPDVLVINDTKVIPARLFGIKQDTKAQVELLLLKQLSEGKWETLVRPGRRIRPGAVLSFGSGRLMGEVKDITEAGGRVIEFQYEEPFETLLDDLGQMPLPPYIHEELKQRNRYQTVYAQKAGSAAAPTAGLHFTSDLIESIKSRGVTVCAITLHVGLGTFRPVKSENIANHHMHSEYYHVSSTVVDTILKAKDAGGRVVAVGTTTTRALEGIYQKHGRLAAEQGWTDIFIYPGFRFNVVDALLTNFHLPRSTLLMLVSAFAGKDFVLDAYKQAVDAKYRFFSFGDAMFIL